MVDQFHDQLANLNPEYTANARKLYDLLVSPAAEQLKGTDTLCIVPDGFLWNLPFQALMPANDRFLLEDHVIYYAPSLSVLREMDNVILKQKSIVRGHQGLKWQVPQKTIGNDTK